MRLYALESFPGTIESLSRANQAAAFFRMSRSIRRRLISRLAWRNSWRSNVVNPSLRCPWSRSVLLDPVPDLRSRGKRTPAPVPPAIAPSAPALRSPAEHPPDTVSVLDHPEPSLHHRLDAARKRASVICACSSSASCTNMATRRIDRKKGRGRCWCRPRCCRPSGLPDGPRPVTTFQNQGPTVGAPQKK